MWFILYVSSPRNRVFVLDSGSGLGLGLGIRAANPLPAYLTLCNIILNVTSQQQQHRIADKINRQKEARTCAVGFAPSRTLRKLPWSTSRVAFFSGLEAVYRATCGGRRHIGVAFSVSRHTSRAVSVCATSSNPQEPDITRSCGQASAETLSTSPTPEASPCCRSKTLSPPDTVVNMMVSAMALPRHAPKTPPRWRQSQHQPQDRHKQEQGGRIGLPRRRGNESCRYLRGEPRYLLRRRIFVFTTIETFRRY